jgi:nucleoside-diphosphate-sugar epimerase
MIGDGLAAGRLFCFGLGYSAERLARRLMAAGWRIGGTVRSADKAAALRRTGIDALPFDSGAIAAALAGVTHVLHAMPPGENGDLVVPRLAPALRATSTLVWAGYLSTPAVYGDRGGAWVDEDAVPSPGSPRGERRLATERAWLATFVDTGVAATVFRLAGIYGPGRSAFDQIASGRARRIDKPGQVFNRIHADDIGTVLLASMTRPRPGGVYNVADGHPSGPNDPIDYAYGLLGLPPPPLVPFGQAGLSAMGREFYAECKRLDVRRLHDELGVTLAFPSFREGLAAIWRGS